MARRKKKTTKEKALPAALRYVGGSRFNVDGTLYFCGAVIQPEEVTEAIYSYMASREDFEPITRERADPALHLEALEDSDGAS